MEEGPEEGLLPGSDLVLVAKGRLLCTSLGPRGREKDPGPCEHFQRLLALLQLSPLTRPLLNLPPAPGPSLEEVGFLLRARLLSVLGCVLVLQGLPLAAESLFRR